MVEFRDASDASKCIEMLHGRPVAEICDTALVAHRGGNHGSLFQLFKSLSLLIMQVFKYLKLIKYLSLIFQVL